MRTPTDATGFPGATVALLNSGADFQMADLYTITLAGGTVLRYTSCGLPLTFNGNTWQAGPNFTRDTITHKIGTETAVLSVDIQASPTDLISGVGFIPYVSANGLDGATFLLERAFLPAWGQPITGTLIEFAGRVTSIKGISRLGLSMTVSSWMVLLNVNMGPDLFQSACLNTLFDAQCQLVKATYQVNSSVSGAGTTKAFNTPLTQADDYFTQGQIKFTSGANVGQIRAVRSYKNASGAITLAFPLPAAVANADTFSIWPGCDRSLTKCKTKFLSDNSIHFRGQPFIPVPETAV